MSMSISGSGSISGIVQKPDHPSFSVVINSGHQYAQTGSFAKITGWQAKSETGGGFDATNSRYVAPVTGRYYIVVSVMSQAQSGSDYQVAIRKNGVEYVRSNDMMAGTWQQTTVPCVVHLNAGEYVEVFARTTNTANMIYGADNMTHWHGHLIG